eukprot:g4080.t1
MNKIVASFILGAATSAVFLTRGTYGATRLNRSNRNAKKIISNILRRSEKKKVVASNVVGLGIDLSHIPRFRGLLSRYEDRFLRRAFHDNEIEEYRTITSEERKITYIASRWAAKEAAYKAFGGKWRIPFPDMYVTRCSTGEPELVFAGIAKCKAKELGIDQNMLTISHDGEYCVAEVLLLCGKR